MSDFLRLLLVFTAAVNPASALGALAAARIGRRTDTVAIGTVVALVLMLLAAVFADDIIAALDLEPETFRIAGGAVLAIAGALAILRGAAAYPVLDGWRGALFPIAIPLLAGPAVLAAAVAYPDEYGSGETAAAAVIVIAATAGLAWAAPLRPSIAYSALARVTGAVLIALAAGLIVDGIHDI